MAVSILPVGDTAEKSAWAVIGQNVRVNLILIGGDSASLHIEAKWGDGIDDAAPMGTLYKSSNSSRAVEPIVGPIVYRVRREAGVLAGCAMEDGTGGGGGSS